MIQLFLPLPRGCSSGFKERIKLQLFGRRAYLHLHTNTHPLCISACTNTARPKYTYTLPEISGYKQRQNGILELRFLFFFFYSHTCKTVGNKTQTTVIIMVGTSLCSTRRNRNTQLLGAVGVGVTAAPENPLQLKLKICVRNIWVNKHLVYFRGQRSYRPKSSTKPWIIVYRIADFFLFIYF